MFILRFALTVLIIILMAAGHSILKNETDIPNIELLVWPLSGLLLYFVWRKKSVISKEKEDYEDRYTKKYKIIAVIVSIALLVFIYFSCNT